MPPVPTSPEPLDALRARYPRALEHLYDVIAIRDRGAIRPGEVAANVFDFEDGLRLIVSRERMQDGEVTLHVSASFPERCRLADEFRLLGVATPKQKILRMFLDSIPGRFAELSGEPRPLEFLGMTNVPHFLIPAYESEG